MSYGGELAAVFSPSLAKRQLLQARDWDYVDQWLSRVYKPRPVPPFERNDETLKVLLSLATESDNAEEVDGLNWKYKGFAVSSLSSKHQQQRNAVRAVEEKMPPGLVSMLNTLAELSTKLDVLDADAEKLAKAILQLKVHDAELDRHVLISTRLGKGIGAGAEPLRMLAAACDDGASFEPPANLMSQLTEWTRTVKMLQQKSYEYKDRASSLENACVKRLDIKKLGLPSFVPLEEEIQELKRRVKTLEGRLKGFSGLPTESDLALLKVEEKLAELQDLVAKRDELYQKGI